MTVAVGLAVAVRGARLGGVNAGGANRLRARRGSSGVNRLSFAGPSLFGGANGFGGARPGLSSVNRAKFGGARPCGVNRSSFGLGGVKGLASAGIPFCQSSR